MMYKIQNATQTLEQKLLGEKTTSETNDLNNKAITRHISFSLTYEIYA